MEIDLENVAIEFCTRNYPLESEPSRALWRYDGAIYLREYEDSEDADHDTQIGTIGAYRLLPEVAHDARMALSDALDYVSENTAQYIQLLNQEGTGLSDEVRDYYNGAYFSLFILDRVEIKPAYRGHRIGLLAARHAIDLVDTSTLVACKPFPLQFAGWQDEAWKCDHPELGERDYEAALSKLRRYWERLGFEQYAPTEIWCLPTELQIPTIDHIAAGRYAEPSKRPRRARHRHRSKAL
jgi:hypothetical protein